MQKKKKKPISAAGYLANKDSMYKDRFRGSILASPVS